MNSVERGRWKLVISASTVAEAVARRDEDVGRAATMRGACRPRAAALSSSRSDVVPTATMRLPRALRGVERGGRRRPRHRRVSACILWSSVSSALTGRNVPAPTCSVTKRALDARRVEPANSSGVKCRPGRRRRHRALLARDRWSGSRAVALVVRALRGDVGRQRHMADRVQRLVEKRRRTDRSASVTSPPSPFSTTVASSVPSKQALPSWPKLDAVADGQPLAGPHEGQPAVGGDAHDAASHRHCAELRRAAATPLSCAGMTLVSLKTSTSPGSSSDGRSRTSGRRAPAPRLDHQQPRSVARLGRAQRDPLVGQVEIEEIDTHQ